MKDKPTFQIPPRKRPSPSRAAAVKAMQEAEEADERRESTRDAAIAEVRRAVERVEARNTAAAPAAPQRKKPKTSKLRRNQRGERLVVHIPPEIEEKVRIRAAEERRSLSDLAEKAFALYLETPVTKDV